MAFRNPFSRNSGLHGLSRFSLKQLIGWGDHLKVDQPQIDAQHEAIFRIALEISEIWRSRGDHEKLKALTRKLQHLLEAHFRFEEQELAEIGYSKLAEHKAEHQVMLSELQVILDRMESGRESALEDTRFSVFNYVLGVTVGHILHSDMDYCVASREATKNEALLAHSPS